MSPRTWRGALSAGFAISLVIHVVMAIQMDWYSVLADEAGYLGNARWLAHSGPVWTMWESSFYSLGYPLVIAPVALLFDGPREVYIGSLLVNCVLLATLFPMLATLARRILQCTDRQALVAAAAGCAVGPAVIQSNIAWSESLVLPVTAALILSAEAVLRSRAHGWVLGAMVGFSVWVHPRFLPVSLVVVAAVAFESVWHRGRPVAVLARVVGTAVVVVVPGLVLARAVRDDRWQRAIGPPGSGNYLRAVTRPGALTGQLAGELWYVLAASAGLAGIGIVALAMLIRRRDPSQGAALVTLAMVVAVGGLSVLSSYWTAARPDQFVYGRYNEALLPVLTAVGAGWLLQAAPMARLVAMGAGAAALGVSALVLLAARPGRVFEGDWNVLNVSGLGPWLDPGGREVVLRATLVVGAVMLGVGALAYGTRAAVAVLALGLAATSLWTFAGPVLDRQDQYATWTGPHDIATRFGQVDHIAYDVSLLTQVGLWGYPLLLPDTLITTYDPTAGQTPPPGVEIVISGPMNPPGGTTGATLVYVDAPMGQGFWQLPPAS